MNNIVSPSILSCDFLNIENEIKAFENAENLWIHLDVMDGHFVPNLTFGIPIIKQLSQMTSLPLDAHLMVTNPGFHMDQMKDFGLKNITFHYEAVENCLGLVQKFRKFYDSIGISIKPKTEINKIDDELLKALDLVLVMSVEPGFGGQSFIPSSIDKIKELVERRTKLNTNFSIQVDGGVSDQNSRVLRDAGASNLVDGSYIFKASQADYLLMANSIR